MTLTHGNNGGTTTIHPDSAEENKVVVDAVCDPDTGTYNIFAHYGLEDDTAGNPGTTEATEETNVVSVSCNS